MAMCKLDHTRERTEQIRCPDRANWSGGFTVVELLVTVAIFVFMTALIIFRYGSFNQGAILTDLAYDVASTVRTAQTYGVSVKATAPVAGVQLYNSAYGVDFSLDTPTKFTMFADTPSGTVGVFDASDSGTSTYNLMQGAKITQLCTGSQASDCNAVHALDISFKRPNPSAVFYSCTSSCGTLGNWSPDSHSYAAITISSADNTSARTVEVRRNGQIGMIGQAFVAGNGPTGGTAPQPMSAPTVVNPPTFAVLTPTSETLNGQVDTAGNTAVYEVGFQFGSTAQYNDSGLSSPVTLTNVSYTDGSTFSLTATGLTCNQPYHMRAFVINAVATAYSQDVPFTTGPCAVAPAVTVQSAGSVTDSSATLNGTITNTGNVSVRDEGFDYDTSPGFTSPVPTRISLGITYASAPQTFSSALTGLTCNTTYYVRAYDTNSSTVGTSYSAAPAYVSFTTLACVTPPAVSNPTATSIGYNSATLGATITDPGSTPVTSEGINWGSNTSYNDEVPLTNTGSFGNGPYSFTVNTSNSNITCGKTYHMQAVVQNSYGQVTSPDVQFSTLTCPAVPANDNFANATILPSQKNVSASGSNLSATLEAGEPTILGNAGGASVWWSWTAPADGNVTISDNGCNFDSVMGVYTGSSVTGLTTITVNDDIQMNVNVCSAVTFFATHGQAYKIKVDGWKYTNNPVIQAGTIPLTITQD